MDAPARVVWTDGGAGSGAQVTGADSGSSAVSIVVSRYGGRQACEAIRASCLIQEGAGCGLDAVGDEVIRWSVGSEASDEVCLGVSCVEY